MKINHLNEVIFNDYVLPKYEFQLGNIKVNKINKNDFSFNHYLGNLDDIKKVATYFQDECRDKDIDALIGCWESTENKFVLIVFVPNEFSSIFLNKTFPGVYNLNKGDYSSVIQVWKNFEDELMLNPNNQEVKENSKSVLSIVSNKMLEKFKLYTTNEYLKSILN